MRSPFFSLHSSAGLWIVCFLLVAGILLLALYFKFRLVEERRLNRKIRRQSPDEKMAAQISSMNLSVGFFFCRDHDLFWRELLFIRVAFLCQR